MKAAKEVPVEELVSVTITRDSQGPLQFTFAADSSIILPGGYRAKAAEMNRVFDWLHRMDKPAISIPDIHGKRLEFTRKDSEKWIMIVLPGSFRVRADQLEEKLAILLDM